MKVRNRKPVESSLGSARVAVLLGSGLGAAGEGFEPSTRTSFDAIPGVTPPGVPGHAGEIRRCQIGTTPCLFIRGRKHVYEGKGAEMVSLLEYVASAGVKELVVTAAVGSLQLRLKPGEFVLVDRIVDFQNRRPTRVPEPTAIPRPETRALTLDTLMNRRLERSALACGVPLVRGTLASCSGPTYETRAEAHALHNAEASVASMSVAPEVATAAALGIRVACLALVTNWVTGITRVPLDHEHVLEAGRSAAGTLERLVAQFVSTA